MRALPRLAALAVLLALPAAGAAQAASAQQAQGADAAAEATAAEALAKIKKGTEERTPEPIKAALVQLDPLWKQLSPVTIQKVVKAISTMFSKLRPQIEYDVDVGLDDPNRANPPDEPDKYEGDSREPVLDCYRTAVGLLSDKPEGPAALLPVLKLPHVKEWPDVRALVLQGLGFREDPALLKDFETYLTDPSPLVASQAARALGRYFDKPMDVRRRAVGSMISALEAADRAAAKEAGKVREGDPTPAADYRASIYVGFHEALLALSHQSFEKTAEWRAWFSEHGKDAAW
jgi:hypothetical protein